jgi:hypothetical protein
VKDRAPCREDRVVGFALVREVVRSQQFLDQAGGLSRHDRGLAGAVRAEPDDAPWPGGDDRLGAGQENSGPVRAESGKNGGIGIDRRGDGGRVMRVARGFPQIR